MRWSWLGDNTDKLWRYGTEHARLALVALVIGVVVSIPLGALCHRARWLYGPVLGLSAILYAVPSLAVVYLLLTWLGLSQWVVIIPLATYTLVIVVRAVVDGLRGVDPTLIDAAVAHGYRSIGRLVRIEIPAASAPIVAGLRVASLSTVSLVTIGGLIGSGGLGQLFVEGFQIDNPISIVAGVVLTLVVAAIFDVAIVCSYRLLAPWTRRAVRR
jgi:osmoprotectant transport system permease protein